MFLAIFSEAVGFPTSRGESLLDIGSRWGIETIVQNSVAEIPENPTSSIFEVWFCESDLSPFLDSDGRHLATKDCTTASWVFT